MTDVLVCVVVVVGDDTWQGSSLRVVHVCVCVRAQFAYSN